MRIPDDIKLFLEHLGTSSLDLIRESSDPITMGFGNKAGLMTIKISRAEAFVASIKLERKRRFRQRYDVLDELEFNLESTTDKEFSEDTLLGALSCLSQETLNNIRSSKEPITFSAHSPSRDYQVEIDLYLEDGKTVPHISIEED